MGYYHYEYSVYSKEYDGIQMSIRQWIYLGIFHRTVHTRCKRLINGCETRDFDFGFYATSTPLQFLKYEGKVGDVGDRRTRRQPYYN
eukprot:8512711-Pyramimonas_sp.AAC.1